MKTIPAACRATLVLATALALTACARSTAARFYQLEPLSAREVVAPADASQGTAVIAVGPVRIPEYLDRPQIVTRKGTNELAVAEFDRWVGPLENDVGRVLAENLAALLPPDRFFVTRWSPLLESQMPVASRVEVRVERFEGPLAGPVIVRAQWGVFERGKGLVFRAESAITEPVSTPTYTALVKAMSKATERLSHDIVAKLLSKPSSAEVSGR